MVSSIERHDGVDGSMDSFIHHFDNHDPNLVDNPYPVFAAMRERCPVAHSDQYGGFWVLTRYKEVVAANRDAKVFISRPGVTLPSFGNPRPLIPLELDAPEHRAFRSLLTPLFSPGSVAKLEPVIRQLTDELIDRFIEKGECDLVLDFARVLPPTILAHIMGVDSEWVPRFIDWAFRIAEADPTHPEEASLAAIGELYACFQGLIETLRAEGDVGTRAEGAELEFTDQEQNMLKILLSAQLDGAPLPTEDVIDTLFLNVLGGSDTTNSAIATSLLWLATHPEERERLREDFSLIPAAIEEFLRVETPVQALARTVTEDVTLGGQQLCKGDKVLLHWGAANRDPDEFPDPEEVVLDRHPNRHVAFGNGPHFCLGAHLARLQIRVALEHILSRLTDFRLAPGCSAKWAVGTTRGLHSFPAVFTPAPRAS
jgi:cytochrome P450